VLEVLAGPDQGRQVTKDTLPLSIGSAADADLRLSDRYASRHHCRILEAEDGSCVLRDEESRNGTFVNGVKIFQVAFEPGAEMQIGRTRIRFGFDEADDSKASCKVEPFGELVGASQTMHAAFAALRRMAPTSLTCLLLGETGTGKELAARGLHAHSRRAGGPFLVIDCGAVSETLIEDKLFGHERGAFTGALKDAEGAFEGANGGTIFLDEIGELSLALQPKLLRVLERREIIRLGSHNAVPVDVRVIAATHRDLQSLVAEGRFRQDLYYRLAEATMWLPPLRTRVEDIDLLARHLLDLAGGPPVVLQADALAVLRHHTWPGNVRELRNVLRRAAAMACTGAINASLLEEVIGSTRTGFPPESLETTRTFSELPIAEARNEHRKEYLKQLLELYGDDHAAVARQMGVHIKYARRLMRKYGFIP
jgi:transcriptional regulator with PAS, ATPase and Fis domain